MRQTGCVATELDLPSFAPLFDGQPDSERSDTYRADHRALEAEQPWAADIRRTRHIGDFSGWKEHDSYQKAFSDYCAILLRRRAPSLSPGVPLGFGQGSGKRPAPDDAYAEPLCPMIVQKARRRRIILPMYCQACGKQIPDESAFCLGCGKPLASGVQQVPPHPTKRSVRWPYIIIILLLAALIWSMIPRGSIRTALEPAASSSGSSPASSLPSLFQTPKSVSLFSGSVAVNAGRIHFITFPTDPDHMGTIHISGRFSATGGMKNDIQAVLCTEDEFQNFSNGNVFR